MSLSLNLRKLEDKIIESVHSEEYTEKEYKYTEYT